MSRTLPLAALALAATLAIAQAACATRVLFVGNSFTSAARVPERLAQLARAMGKDVTCDSVAPSSFSLEDHWKDGRALAAIAKGWDVVVLQQGPSTQPGEAGRLADYARRFAQAIRKSGARPALLMVWPSSDRLREFPATIQAYRAAAKASDATLIPVGEAWLRMLSKDPRTRLYSGEFHPSANGSSLAVLTIYFSLFPAGPQEFTEKYVARIARELELDDETRDQWFDAATLAIDQPLALK